jgi:lipopolysaccharide export system permease protein
MSLVSRYIFRQTASALITILISLTLIVWLTSVLREIKLLTTEGQGFLIFLQITTLAIPNLLVTVAPIAFLIASLHTLNRLNGDSELIVFSAAGASVWRVLTPYMNLAVLVSIFVIVANCFLVPRAMRVLGDYIAQVRSDLISQVLQPGEFTDLERGLTFHLRDKGKNGDLLGIMVHDARDPKVATTVLAEHGRIVKQKDDRAVMVMTDGQIHRQRQGSDDVQIVVFQSYLFDLSDFAPQEGPRDLKPRERSIGELLHPDTSSAYYKKHKRKFRSEIHERLSAGLYPILFALIALVHLGRPRTTREDRAVTLFGAFAVAAAIRVMGLAGINLAGKHAGALLLVYGAPLAAMAVCLFMLAFNLHPPGIALPRFRLPLPALLRGERRKTAG